MPSFATRTHAEEMMDDFSITDERLTDALEQLRWVNRLLGGYATMMTVLRPFFQANTGRPIRLLDIGTGIADYPEYLIRWADRHQLDLHITAIDANPATIKYANHTLEKRLTEDLRDKVTLEVADAFSLPYDDDAFEVVMAAMFLHHFPHEEATILVKEMDRVAGNGLIINDLHRYPLAYYGILLPATILPVSPMFRNDGPLSVLRGFRRSDLEAIARDADLPTPRIRWHWAFRWSLSTL